MRYKKLPGVTILEMLVASGMAALVLTSVVGLIGTSYLNQRRVEYSVAFYNESRLLMERISQTIRNNTIDYDRFFEAERLNNALDDDWFVGASPEGDCLDRYLNWDLDGEDIEREDITYPLTFRWDTTGDDEVDRNLGGKDNQGDDDTCSIAWFDINALDELYLINSNRTMRTAVRLDTTNDRIEVERLLGADTDNDGVADLWGPFDLSGDGDLDDTDDVRVLWNSTNSVCELQHMGGLDPKYPIMDRSDDEYHCKSAHEYTVVSPNQLQVNTFTFLPAPQRDPYLAFRIDADQVQPNIFLIWDIELRNRHKGGFTEENKPRISFQTGVSSRVFGDTR